MTWISVNVCFFHSYVRDLEFCFYTCMMCMYIPYICLGNEVLSTKLDVHHSDHTWQSWHDVHQGTVMRGMSGPDVNCSLILLHTCPSVCMYECIYKVISAADVCSISDAEYRYDVCQTRNEWRLWLTPYTQITNHTLMRETVQLKTSFI